MNSQRKKIVLTYVVFLCVLALFFFLIVGYAVSQGHIAGYGDFFRKATDPEERFWIRMAFVAIMNLFAFSSIIFIGLLIFLKKSGRRGSQ
jgi:TRAP-type C4-dicarboxylate transport system permease small subunit